MMETMPDLLKSESSSSVDTFISLKQKLEDIAGEHKVQTENGEKRGTASRESLDDPMPVGADEKVSSSTYQERAIGWVKRLSVILINVGASIRVVKSFEEQLFEYLLIEDELTFFARAKYVSVLPMAMYLHFTNPGSNPDLPKTPDKEFSFQGVFKRWAKNRLRWCTMKHTWLWYSILQGKRAAYPLTEDVVYSTYVKHRVAMEKPDGISEEVLEQVMSLLEPLLDQISSRLIKSYIPPNLDNELERVDGTSHCASQYACFETSRTRGGQMNYLKSLSVAKGNYLNRCDSDPTDKIFSLRVEPVLVGMEFHTKVRINGVVYYNITLDKYDYPDGRVVWANGIVGELDRVGVKEIRKAKVASVLEPLKVRTISKGEGVPYYLSKPLQLALFSILKKYRCFSLIGEPLCPTALIDLSKNRSNCGEGPHEHFSVDYSAATDELSARLSKCIMERILCKYPESWKEIWLPVLAPHHVSYPRVKGHPQIPPVQQQNGQLMGSVLSFPILCLANLGLYLAVLGKNCDARSIWEKMRGVLINGDDMLYVARRSLWESHIKIGREIGLIMSPGKAYHHPIYANANSACFHYDLSKTEPNSCGHRSVPVHIPYLNTGLMFGQGKLLAEEGRLMSSVVTQVCQGAAPGQQVRLLKLYLSIHKDAIRRECKGRNLFMDISLGGMGQKAPYGWQWWPTERQRMVAAHLVQQNRNGFLGNGVFWEQPKELDVSSVRVPWLARFSDQEWEDTYEQRLLDVKDSQLVKLKAHKSLLSVNKCTAKFVSCLKRRHEGDLFFPRGLKGKQYIPRIPNVLDRFRNGLKREYLDSPWSFPEELREKVMMPEDSLDFNIGLDLQSWWNSPMVELELPVF